ncbi:hypothetical protein M9434_007221 [Picochlorum sp. BPE23]|nr:hypothetical protein M9434_007221 [Picochlorum sp. BPE23]
MQCAQLEYGDERTLSHAKQAAKDWESILRARAAEMKKGARFIFVTCWDALWEKKVISDEERLAVSFPSYYRTLEEMVGPVQDGGALSDIGLRVVSANVRIVRCPYRQAWESGASQAAGRDAAAHAAWYVPTTRTWSNSTFESALSSSRPAQERSAIVKQFWGEYEALVAQAPEKHGMDYVHGYCLFERV